MNKNQISIMTKFVAFTLAEVLITLGIVGVVAEMTIPTVVSSYQKQLYATQLEHFISEFNNSLGVIKADMNCIDLACTGIWNNPGVDYPTRSGGLWTKLKATGKLKIIKDCGLNTGEGCFGSSETSLNGSPVATSLDNDPSIAKFILANGVSVAMWDDGAPWGQCVTKDDGSPWGEGALTEMCGPMSIDVNGPKKPNKWGSDLFHLRITNKGGVLPVGISVYRVSTRWNNNDAGTACDPVTYPTGNGLTCSGRIAEQGWQIKY